MTGFAIGPAAFLAPRLVAPHAPLRTFCFSRCEQTSSAMTFRRAFVTALTVRPLALLAPGMMAADAPLWTLY